MPKVPSLAPKVPTKSITQDDLYKAFLVWTAEYRAGITASDEITNAKPIEQVATESAESFWARLPG